MITLSKLVENCLQAVAIAFLTLLCIPGLATALGVDVAGSAVAIAVVVSCLALILPKINAGPPSGEPTHQRREPLRPSRPFKQAAQLHQLHRSTLLEST
jgi:hypothetical protein